MLNSYFYLITHILITITTYTMYCINIKGKFFKKNIITKSNLGFLKILFLVILLVTLYISKHVNYKISTVLLIANIVMLAITTQLVPIILLQSINYLLISLLNINSVLELLIILEVLNIVTVFNILTDKKLFLSKKGMFSSLIGVNVTVLTTLVLCYFYITTTLKTTNIQLIEINNLLSYNNNIQYLLLFASFLKIGVLTGPKFNLVFYQNLSKNWLYLYIYTYYLVIPLVLFTILTSVNVSNLFIFTVTSLMIIVNSSLFSKLRTFRDLIFISGQLNLIYIQLLLLN